MIKCGKLMNLLVAKSLMKGYFAQGNFDNALNLFFNYHYSHYLGVEGLVKKSLRFSVRIHGVFEEWFRIRNWRIEGRDK